MTQYLYLSRIGEFLPDLYAQEIEQTNGQFSDVLIINCKWVFRFPRYRDGAERMRYEIDLLQALQGRLPIPIPDPQVSAVDPLVPGLAFCGCGYIPGKPLSAANMEGAEAGLRDSLAGQIAGFLRAMHSLPLVGLPAHLPGSFPEDHYAAVQVRDLRPEWEAMYAEVKEKLFPAMHLQARRKVSEHFEIYLDDPRLQKFIPCLRHGDFGGDNILWEPSTGQVTGVIDFSFAAIGDPALDLASASTLGNAFFNSLARQYEPDPQTRPWLMARAIFYSYLFPLMEALDGLKYADEAAYARGIEKYI